MISLDYKKHITPGVCAVKNCTNKCVGSLCSTCRSKKTRSNDPVRYAYNNLKNNAKKRGILFTITLDQFREWCSKVTYIGFAGRSSNGLTIDRKYNDVGYHLDNIRVLTRRENIKKYFSYDYRLKTVVFTESIEFVGNPEDLDF